jgi:hypothetical protein
MDLDAYFSRIGYDGSGAITFATLREIHQRHVHSIAFENLNAYLGLPIELGIDCLQRNLVYGGRGGWCFEPEGRRSDGSWAAWTRSRRRWERCSGLSCLRMLGLMRCCGK